MPLDEAIHVQRANGLPRSERTPKSPERRREQKTPWSQRSEIAPYHLSTCELSLDTHRLDQYFSRVLRVRCSGTVISCSSPEDDAMSRRSSELEPNVLPPEDLDWRARTDLRG